MGSLQRPFKLYFVPFLTPGHMVPLFELARLFAARGIHVTFFTTPANALLLRKAVDKDVAAARPISLHVLHFPSREAGIPDGIENLLDGAVDAQTLSGVCKGIAILEERFQDAILQNPPDCLVVDFVYSWASDLAARLDIPAIAFNSFCLFSVCAIHSLKSFAMPGSGPFIIPDLPHQISMNFQPPEEFNSAMVSRIEASYKTNGIIMNNFAELDGEYAEHYEKISGHRVRHIGPAGLIHRTAEEKTERSHKSAVKEHECLSWLDSKEPNSVLYVCFGSSCRFSDAQLYEIASGLESSGCDFIWVVSGKDITENETEEEREKWMPKGFEGKVKRENKGMVVRGWAPQLLILGHEAIGGFMTHCGWNSVVEGITAGVPMITWPVHSEQFYNEKLITEVHGIGVEVGTEEWALWVFDGGKKMVTRDRIEKAVRKVMDGGDEAMEMRKRVGELGKKAKEAVQEGGSSHTNLTALITELIRWREAKPLDQIQKCEM
ncbi:UDP-glucose flavonoid 3-O-glucosyltransferase 7-like [Neltuma alba]|uniref:UDP-glucose flavonoid 3-O-glucosyltransferase 7-like n=1 Tax=Neltuma alba TaxID=207710 RepID=UPI0010A51221|nr:UDP-glucose flavonoid 3-O-glucosyltransferase 7-like [Prosopis alba]